MTAYCPHCGRPIWMVRPRNAGDANGNGIEQLEIGIRAYNCLRRVGIYTIWDLENHDDAELMGIPNFGKTSLAEVKDALAQWKAKQRGVSNQESKP